MSYTLRFIFHHLLKQWARGKRGRNANAKMQKFLTEMTEMQNFEYLKNKESFLDEIKSMFHNYLSAISW